MKISGIKVLAVFVAAMTSSLALGGGAMRYHLDAKKLAEASPA